MSTNERRVGTTLWLLPISASLSRRGSGTETSPTLGSMVQKGKFAAWAAAVWVRALKSVDLPTLGRPTMPHLKPMKNLGDGARRGREMIAPYLMQSAAEVKFSSHGAHRCGHDGAKPALCRSLALRRGGAKVRRGPRCARPFLASPDSTRVEAADSPGASVFADGRRGAMNAPH